MAPLPVTGEGNTIVKKRDCPPLPEIIPATYGQCCAATLIKNIKLCQKDSYNIIE